MKLKPKEHIALVLKHYGLPYVEEHMFHVPKEGEKKRRFRFDWAFPKYKVAIEYEGIKGKSRHTTLKGYSNDCIKYNLAVKQGWKVLRYTVLTYKDLLDDLKEIL